MRYASTTSARGRLGVLVLAFGALTLALLSATPSAHAATTRAYQSSFGSFPEFFSPRNLAVDQSNGDVYVVSNSPDRVSRFDASGAPKNFTAGPNAGTNTLTGFNFYAGSGDVAVDSSGGPLSGNIYVANSQDNAVEVFAGSGAHIGTLVAPDPEPLAPHFICGVGVDQTSGAVYFTDSAAERAWRYSPVSASGSVDNTDYTITGISGPARFCHIAADGDNVYATSEGTLREYSAASFSAALPPADFEVVANGVSAVDVDPQDGDVYADEGKRISVFDSAGTFLYRFGRAVDFGDSSAGVAVKSASSGPAATVYVADRHQGGHQADVYGGLTQVPTVTHPRIADFGRDGTASSVFEQVYQLALDRTTHRLYAVENGSSPGIFGFDASSPPAFPPLTGFTPLATANPGITPGLAVDGTALGSAGAIYFASQDTDLLYGFGPTGTPLGGAFPVDPTATPGPPAGSPADLCGAAVDSAGDIWLANSTTKRILEYSSAGSALPGTINTSGQGSPCSLAFDADDNLYAALDSGLWRYTAASGYSAATRISPAQPQAIAVDSSTGRLYAAYPTWVDEFDSNGSLVDEFATEIDGASFRGIAVDPSNHYVYLADTESRQIHVFGPGVILPEAAIAGTSALLNTSVTLNGAVNTQGFALEDCRFEYVTEAAYRINGFGDLSSGGEASCDPAAGSIPTDLDDHPVSAVLSGLSEKTSYRFRLSASNAEGTTVTTDSGFETAGPPDAETTGSPIRSAATARLEGRVNPRGATTTYHFEYGSEGPCDANPCESTAATAAGTGNLIELVSQQVSGLAPGTTYHYRLVADNGNVDGPAYGADMTVSTRPSDVPLSHGHFPGPPGSDRAWEQVNLPDTGGNPVSAGYAFSDSGDRAIYQIPGGTPITDSGSAFNQFYAERTPDGWRSKQILPPRDAVVGPNWLPPFSDAELSGLFAFNANLTSGQRSFWRLRPGGTPTKLVDASSADYGGFFVASADASRQVVDLIGPIDPVHPAPAQTENLYDVSTDPPQLLSLLPGDTVGACGVGGSAPAFGLQDMYGRRTDGWVSADGALLFFPSKGNDCAGASQLYMRDIAAGDSVRISGSPVSGPACGAGFIKSTPGAVFFWTQARLTAEDTAPAECKGEADGDVYRYDVGSHGLDCLTCVVAGLDADVAFNPGSAFGGAQEIAVAENGSRVYFRSPRRLLPGAQAPGAYRVDVASGELAYVAPIGNDDHIGDYGIFGNALTPDGSVLIFRSSDAALNQVNGSQNGGTAQYYRYDDRDRSLICASCPPDGSPAAVDAINLLASPASNQVGPNADPLSDSGDFIFSTPNRLVEEDQNTAAAGDDPIAGTDLYEWRDGRVLLVSDGATDWPAQSVAPLPSGISPSGRDVFFTASAQYTADALDPYNRLYDARIGGGFDFPEAAKPCSLELCQGTPKGAPAGSPVATGVAAGSGNVKAGRRGRHVCPKGRHRGRRGSKARCSRHHRRTKHGRGTGR